MNKEVVNNNKKKIRCSKWIYLSIALLINAFIIVQAALPATESVRWSNVFVRFFMNIFNSSGKDTTEVIDVTNLELNYDKDYQYNYIEGYTDNELVIGTSKRLSAVISPSNATNSAVSYTSSNPDIVKIRQNENYAYIEGLEVGSVDITVTSLDNNTFIDKYTFNVIEAKAPITYEVADIEVYKDSFFYLPIKVENETYYDVDKLDISHSSSNTSKSEEYEGLYYASSIGSDLYIVDDKSFNVVVKDNSSVIYPQFNSIKGDEVIYPNSSRTYEVVVDNTPTSKDVIWSTSNNEICSINKDGVLSVKDIKEETKIVITARSLLDDELYINKEVTVKPVQITSFELVIPYYGNHITNMSHMGETGEEIKVWIEDNTGTIGISGVSATSSDESVAKVYVQGSYLYINCIKEGDTKITVTSIANPEVSKFVNLQVAIRGVINHDNYLSFYEFVRKSIGHFLLFMVNGIFTYLFMYELSKDVNYKKKKCWHHIVLTIVLGLFFAGLSEFIQFLTPTRYGSFMDVGVDFLGYLLGVGITLLVIYLIHRHKKKKLELQK